MTNYAVWLVKNFEFWSKFNVLSVQEQLNHNNDKFMSKIPQKGLGGGGQFWPFGW